MSLIQYEKKKQEYGQNQRVLMTKTWVQFHLGGKVHAWKQRTSTLLTVTGYTFSFTDFKTFTLYIMLLTFIEYCLISER